MSTHNRVLLRRDLWPFHPKDLSQGLVVVRTVGRNPISSVLMMKNIVRRRFCHGQVAHPRAEGFYIIFCFAPSRTVWLLEGMARTGLVLLYCLSCLDGLRDSKVLRGYQPFPGKVFNC